MSLAIQIESCRKLVSAKRLATLSFLCLLGAVDLVWAYLCHISFTGFELTFYGVIALLSISVIYGRFRIDRRLSEASYYVALWILFTALSAPFTYMAATLGFPLYDEIFVRLDRSLGFDWPAYYNFFSKNEITYDALMVAYSSFIPQILFAVIFFSHTGKHDRNNELFSTATISLLITAVASGVFPAAGALYHFGTGLDHAVHLHDYFALRNGNISQFAIGKLEGIITFPSYHTVIAILMIYVYRGTRIFLLTLALNALMLLSIPIFGGHYLVDMLGGAAVAAFSIHAAGRTRRYFGEDSAIP